MVCIERGATLNRDKNTRNAITERSNAVTWQARRVDGKDRGAEARGDVDEAQKREIFNPIGAYIATAGAALPTPINWCQCTYAAPARYTSEYYAHSAPAPRSSRSTGADGSKGGKMRGVAAGRKEGEGGDGVGRRRRTYTSRTTTPRLCRIEHN